jgi:hypothetical protein
VADFLGLIGYGRKEQTTPYIFRLFIIGRTFVSILPQSQASLKLLIEGGFVERWFSAPDTYRSVPVWHKCLIIYHPNEFATMGSCFYLKAAIVMRHIKLLLTALFFLVCSISLTRANTTATKFSLWYLASENNYTNSRYIEYDPHNGQVISEVLLPPELAVTSATISPNFKFIATITGTRSERGDAFGSSICIFAINGNLIECRNFSILSRIDGTSAPLRWSDNSKKLYFVAAERQENFMPNTSAQLMSWNVEETAVSVEANINYQDVFLTTWLWSPDGRYAVLRTDSKDKGVGALIVQFEPEFKYIALEEEWYVASVSAAGILYVGNDNQLHIAQVDNGSVRKVSSLSEVRGGNPQVVFATGLSRDGTHIAFQAVGENSDGQKYELRPLFLYSFSENIVHAGEYLFIHELLWSPDNNYLAIEVCNRYLTLECYIDVVTSQGGKIAVNVNHPEIHNATWVTRPVQL